MIFRLCLPHSFNLNCRRARLCQTEPMVPLNPSHRTVSFTSSSPNLKHFLWTARFITVTVFLKHSLQAYNIIYTECRGHSFFTVGGQFCLDMLNFFKSSKIENLKAAIYIVVSHRYSMHLLPLLSESFMLFLGYTCLYFTLWIVLYWKQNTHVFWPYSA